MEGFPKPRIEEGDKPVRAEEIEVILKELKGKQDKLEDSQTTQVDEFELPPDQAAVLNDVLKDIQKG